MAALAVELPFGGVEGFDSDVFGSTKSAWKGQKFEEENVVDESDKSIKDGDGDGEGDGDDGCDSSDISESEWMYEMYDYDSDSYFEDEETKRKEEEELRRKFSLYNKQIIKSEGFDVDPESIPNVPYFGGFIRPVNLEDKNSLASKWVRKCVAVAIKEHNRKEEEKLRLVDILKANQGPASGRKYYITFDARDIRDRSKLVRTYQCAAVYGVCGADDEFGVHVIFLRPKPKKKVRCRR